MSLTLPVIPSQLPQGFCPADYQEMLNQFDAHSSVVLPTGQGSGIVVSATKPLDTTAAWLQLDQFGRPVRLYWFAQGAWLALHSLAPGSTVWWFEALPDFTTFDGGDSSPASTITGPMWQAAKLPNGTTIAAQFPLVAGTLPSGVVLNPGDTGGEEKHTLLLSEIPGHTHSIADLKHEDCPGGNQDVIGTPQNAGGNGPLPLSTQSTGGDVDGNAVGHNTMPPYAVGYLLQRTGRLYYAVT